MRSLPGWQPIRKLAIPFQVAVDVERFAGRWRVQGSVVERSYLLHQIGKW